MGPLVRRGRHLQFKLSDQIAALVERAAAGVFLIAAALVFGTSASVHHAPLAPPNHQLRLGGFEIPRQPLSSALLTFSEQAHVTLIASHAPLMGSISTPVFGAMPPNEALTRLLACTDFEGRVENGVVRLRVRPRLGATAFEQRPPAGVDCPQTPPLLISEVLGPELSVLQPDSFVRIRSIESSARLLNSSRIIAANTVSASPLDCTSVDFDERRPAAACSPTILRL